MFSQARDRRLPVGIQAIAIQDSLFQTYRREVDFIQRYVLPAEMRPSPKVLKSLGERFGIPVIRECIFGQDYAKTLASRRNNLRAAWPNPMPSGFDDRFRRLREYYLAYCEAGFPSGKSTCARWCSQSRNSSRRTIGCKTGFHFCHARSRVVTRLSNTRFPANEHQT